MSIVAAGVHQPIVARSMVEFVCLMNLQSIHIGAQTDAAVTIASAGAGYEFDFNTSFPSTINSPAETQNAVDAAINAFGAEQVNPECEPYTTSEDFANMLRVKPGSYGLIGNGGEAGGGCALHNPKYDFNDRILLKGVAYWVSLVEAQLQ